MALSSSYSVHLQVFEGPLDLLLELIERAELDITKVALAQVTDQYLAYLRQMPERQLADLASFLVVAARLLQIKSEALLPCPPQRELDEEDPGEALARQLIAYKKYKQIAHLLSARERQGLRSYVRLAPPPTVPAVLELSNVAVDDLRRAFLEALAPAEDKQPLSEVVAAPHVNIRDQIRLIAAAIRARGKTTFRRLLRRVRSRIEVVVTFLAVLELVKQRKVAATQERLFGDIELTPAEGWQEGQEFEFELEFER
ncbi:MAG: segregation/condensation protein A [Chloroflexota bacterium]